MRTLGIGAGEPSGFFQLALDPATHTAAIVTSCQVHSTLKNRTELTIVNLSTGATTPVFQHLFGVENEFHNGLFIGGDSPVVGIDVANHLILQRSMLCPASLGNFDINARVCLNEYDESGRLVKTVPGLFSDADLSFFFSGVNGTARIGRHDGAGVTVVDLRDLHDRPAVLVLTAGPERRSAGRSCAAGRRRRPTSSRSG